MPPRHKNPNKPERTAMAPYNFVPLPNAVFTVEDGEDKPWRQHEQFVPGAHSGWIDVHLKTLTPLYIRGERRQGPNGEWETRDARFRAAPFQRFDGRPVIPGASLRGAIRNLFEILTFGKIQPVSNKPLFFRSVGRDRMAQEYRRRIVQGEAKPEGGFIRHQDGTWVIEPAEATWRVPHQFLRPHSLQYSQSPDYTPTWRLQHRVCWFLPGLKGAVAKLELEEPAPGERWERGVLVLTGSSPEKKKEFLFVEAANPQRIEIPQAMWKQFHDGEQITRWQEVAFPRDEPKQKCRKLKGHLRDGEPVFFLCDQQRAAPDNPNGLVFFGRAQMFRFPYDLRPNGLVPSGLRTSSLDLAEVVFGRVGQEGGKRDRSFKGRVFVEDAVAAGSPPTGGWLEKVLVPKILSAPKPTTFQHYLTQDGTKGEKELTTYFDGDHTSIRGHKRYWHRWDDSRKLETVREGKQQNEILASFQAKPGHRLDDEQKFTQHTVIQPVKAGVTFKGRIRFENLTDIELGALMEAVQLPDSCAHNLGMAKPLGLGSVRMEATLRLVDHSKRYDGWQADGIVDKDASAFRAAFTRAMLKHAEESREPLLKEQVDLRRIARLDALYRLLEWEDRPTVDETRYMVIVDGDMQRFSAGKRGNEYHGRPVLPSPHGVMNIKEPPWGDSPPHPGFGLDGGAASPRLDKHSMSASRSLPRSGDRVEAVLLEGKTNKGGWRAEHVATGIPGPIQNSGEVPADKKAGDTMSLLVVSANRREIAFKYPTEADQTRAKRSGKSKGKGRQQRRGPKGKSS